MVKRKVALMVKLSHSLTYEIKPFPPYNFDITIRKPAGWPLFTPLEVYEKSSLWTAVTLSDIPVGLRLTSKGTTENPHIEARIFLERKLSKELLDKIKNALVHSIGADDDLGEFYALAKKDPILNYVVADLFGMHSTFVWRHCIS